MSNDNATATARTVKYDPVGSFTCDAIQIDGVEFVFDRRTSQAAFDRSERGDVWVGWFSQVTGYAFEASTPEALIEHARTWFRREVASVVKAPNLKPLPTGSVVYPATFYASYGLKRRDGQVVAYGSTPTALRCFAASQLWVFGSGR